VAVLNQPKIKRLFAEKIRYTGANFWITRIIISFHQIKFSATKITQRWTGANPSFAIIPTEAIASVGIIAKLEILAMTPGIRIIKDPIA
jgi:hypothetical protein